MEGTQKWLKIQKHIQTDTSAGRNDRKEEGREKTEEGDTNVTIGSDDWK